MDTFIPLKTNVLYLYLKGDFQTTTNKKKKWKKQFTALLFYNPFAIILAIWIWIRAYFYYAFISHFSICLILLKSCNPAYMYVTLCHLLQCKIKKGKKMMKKKIYAFL